VTKNQREGSSPYSLGSVLLRLAKGLNRSVLPRWGVMKEVVGRRPPLEV
jgi:hypothetical protein